MLLLYFFGFATAYPVLVVLTCVLFVQRERRRYALHHKAYQTSTADADGREVVTVGIFHPYANGGGGGERVLYCALAALTKRFQDQGKKLRLQLVLYAGDDGLAASELLAQSAARFNLPDVVDLKVDTHVRLVTLPSRELLEPLRYPRFTLLWQSVAQVRLAAEAFREGEKQGLFPQYWIDTTGCPFSYVVASIRYGCTVVAYVHYPMISTDMIDKVQQRSADYNNDNAVAGSAVKSLVKYIYYRLFAAVYGLVGCYCTDVVMVNSTWTYNHIRQLWRKQPVIVYPPCGSMAEFEAFAIDGREDVALSIAQFRPEKNHLLQLQALKVMLDEHPEAMATRHAAFKLVLLGSCRNKDDDARVDVLREQCEELGLTNRVEFVVNAPFRQLKQHLSRASIGLHTMYNEHFGISVVEMMAAGLVVVANNSGGPAADIVTPGTGHLALTAKEYAAKLFQVLEEQPQELRQLRTAARQSAHRFSDDEFSAQFLAAVDPVFPQWQS